MVILKTQDSSYDIVISVDKGCQNFLQRRKLIMLT